MKFKVGDKVKRQLKDKIGLAIIPDGKICIVSNVAIWRGEEWIGLEGFPNYGFDCCPYKSSNFTLVQSGDSRDEFNIGDRVEIVRSCMPEIIGVRGTVTRIEMNGLVWARWDDDARVQPLDKEQLKKVEDVMKFKVGDMVIGNAEADNHYSITRKGWIGRVEHVDGNSMKVDGIGGLNIQYFDLYRSPGLKEKIESLQSFGREAFEVMAEIGGKYTIDISTNMINSSGKYLNLYKEHDSLGVPGTVEGRLLIKSFEYDSQCQIERAFKDCLLFMAKREGKLGPQVGEEIKTEIEGRVYKVKILQEA